MSVLVKKKWICKKRFKYIDDQNLDRVRYYEPGEEWKPLGGKWDQQIMSINGAGALVALVEETVLEDEPIPEIEEREEEFDLTKVAGMQAKLKELGLPSYGKKAVLQKRLEDAGVL